MLQLNKEELQTLLNACEMARAEYSRKIATMPFYNTKTEPTFADYIRHKNFPYKSDNELRWEKQVEKLNALISRIKEALKT
ncbi:MAG: hypothetical protein IJW53_00935 [Clostridia bacterium]|nr:hypothetical protein [Clostridia bacterium]